MKTKICLIIALVVVSGYSLNQREEIKKLNYNFNQISEYSTTLQRKVSNQEDMILSITHKPTIVEEVVVPKLATKKKVITRTIASPQNEK